MKPLIFRSWRFNCYHLDKLKAVSWVVDFSVSDFRILEIFMPFLSPYSSRYRFNSISPVLHIALHFNFKNVFSTLISRLQTLNFSSNGLHFLVEDEAVAKTAKVDILSSQYVGGVLPGSLAAGYPPRATFGTVPPLYVCMDILPIFWNFLMFEEMWSSFSFICCSSRISIVLELKIEVEKIYFKDKVN